MNRLRFVIQHNHAGNPPAIRADVESHLGSDIRVRIGRVRYTKLIKENEVHVIYCTDLRFSSDAAAVYAKLILGDRIIPIERIPAATRYGGDLHGRVVVERQYRREAKLLAKHSGYVRRGRTFVIKDPIMRSLISDRHVLSFYSTAGSAA